MTSEENISESGLTLSEEDLIMSNRFTCIEEIYSSKKGYATIYRAQRMGKWHTLKCLKREYANSTMHLGLLQKEFDICYRLSHPNIVHVLGMEKVEGLGLCIVMEYVDGCTLRRFMDEGRMTKNTACNIISQICDALAYIHGMQIVHRDLKPENVMITTMGNYVKLIDFGCSDADSYAVLKLPAGTRRYSAPEQANDGKVDIRADLFALGIIINELNAVLPHCSYTLKRIFRRCTRREPEKRYASAEEVKRRLGKRGYKNITTACLSLLVLALVVYVFYKETGQLEYVRPVPTIQANTSAMNSKPVDGERKTIKEYTDVSKKDVPHGKATPGINVDDRMAHLVAFAKQNTRILLDDVYRQLNDSTLDKEYRRRLASSYYFDVEKAIKAEVDRVVPSESPENAVYWSAIRNVVAETSKSYHLNKMKGGI